MYTTKVHEEQFGIQRSAKIIADSYWAKVELWKDGIIYSNKNHFYQDKNHHDCYASDHFLAFANLPPDRVKIRSADKYIPLNGFCVLYQPPFTLIETVTKSGELTWECIAFKRNNSVNINNPKVLLGSYTIPKSKEDINNLLQTIELNGLDIIQETSPSGIAEKLKKSIDKNFCENITLTEISKQLNCSRVVLARAFTKTYNISPVEYRHRLRIHEALLKVRAGLSITDALYEVGFSDPSQFVHHFKRLLGTTPNQYKIMNKL